MHLNTRSRFVVCSLIAALTWAGSAAAVDNTVIDNLKRSRDALLTQRQNLQESADAISRRIDELQHQLDSVNSYLRDTDSAIHDVDGALGRY